MVKAAIGDGETVRVTSRGDGWLVKLHGRGARESLLAMNGRSLANGLTQRISVVEDKMSLDDLFEWVENELKCQERSDSYGRSWTGWQEDTGRGERREATAVQSLSQVRTLLPPRLLSQPSLRVVVSTGRPRLEPMLPPVRVRTAAVVPGSTMIDLQVAGTAPPSPRGKGGGKGGKGASGRPRTPSPGDRREAATSSSSNGSAGRPRTPSPRRECHLCGDPKHSARHCPQFSESQCFLCNKKGHWKAECPQRSAGGTPAPRRGSQ